MYKHIDRLVLVGWVVVLLLATILPTYNAYAISAEQKRLYNSGVLYYDKGFNNDCVLPSTAQSNSKVYVVGDSISVGIRDSNLSSKLKEKGYTDIRFNASQNRSISRPGVDGRSGLNALKDDEDFIKEAGTVLVVLGTNPESGFETNMRGFLKELNSINGSARKFWINVGVTAPNFQQNMNSVNKTLNDNSGDFDYKVVDWAAKVRANKSLISGDKVHPTAAGYSTLSNMVAESFGKIETTTTSVKTDGSIEKNKLAIWTFLVGKGLTPYQAAGIMGNMQAESGFEPRKVQYGYRNSRGEISVAGQSSSLDNNVPPDQESNGSPGYGLVQWTFPPYKEDLRNYSKQKNSIAGNLQLQLDFLWLQLTTERPGYSSINYILNEIKKTTNVNEASDVWLIKYENPADIEGTKPERRAFAEKILKQFGGIAGIVSGCDNSLVAGGLGWDLEGANKMVYYSQTDPKWANQKYGNCSGDPTIAESGCGPTSIAMIVATLTGNGVIPPEIAKYSVENGYRTCGVGTDHALGADIAKKYNLNYSEFGTNFDKAIEILKKGGLVWVSVGKGTFTSSGHLMIIRKVSNDGQSFYLADPISEAGATNGESNTKAYTREELLTSGNLSAMYGFIK